MTANDMKYQFLLGLEALYEFTAPAYDDTQISMVLTNAQNRCYLRYYNPKSNRYREGFEAGEQRRKELDELIKAASFIAGTIATSSSQIGVHPNGSFFDLPSDTRFLIEETAVIDTTGTERRVKPVTHDEYIANRDNPFKKPYGKLVWRMDFSKETDPTALASGSSKRVELVTDGSGIVDYRIRYLRNIPDIVVDEVTPNNQVHSLLEEIHYKIVDEAIAIATKAIKPEEYQIARSETTVSE